MAPFWDDIDTRKGGTISYETFESGYYLEQVNAYIQGQRQNTFQGTWMINVYYKEVAPVFSSVSEVAPPFSGSGSRDIAPFYGPEVVSGSTLIRRWRG